MKRPKRIRSLIIPDIISPDFHELNSFNEMLQRMFDKDNPQNLGQLDYSTVVSLEE
jgi:hypothetical protein